MSENITGYNNCEPHFLRKQSSVGFLYTSHIFMTLVKSDNMEHWFERKRNQIHSNELLMNDKQ